MIKECNIILHNTATLVIDFDGKHIQLPRIEIKGEKVYVECEDGKYTISSKEEYDKSLKTKSDKKTKKNKAMETELVDEIVDLDIINDDTD